MPMCHSQNIRTILITFTFCVFSSLTLGICLVSETGVNMKQIPDGNNTIIIGMSDFKQLINGSNIFADKTSWIKEVLKVNSKYILVTCPRKSCKSSNLNMLKSFLEIEYKNDTYQVTENYRLFRKSELHWNKTHVNKYSNPLMISKHTKVLDKYQGKYPVIFIDLDIPYFILGKRGNLEDILLERISQIYNRFPHICDVFEEIHDKASSLEKQTAYEKLTKCKALMERRLDDPEDLYDSICLLCEALYRRYKNRVFLLVDNYDGLMQLILSNNVYSTANITSMLDSYTTFLHRTLHKNDYLEKCVLTGILHIYDDHLLPQSSNLTVYDAMNNNWQHFFGFHEKELRGFFQYQNLTNNYTDKGYKWFRGYNMHRDINITIFNPWSISNFIIYELIHNYWAISGGSQFLMNLVSYKPLRDIIEKLFFMASTPVRFDYLYFTKRELLQLREIIFNMKNCILKEDEITELLLKYLCSAGYLTYAGKSYDHTGSGVIVSALRLPNHEVATEWWKRLTDYYTYHLKIPDCEMLTWSQTIDSFIQNKTGRDDMIKYTQDFYSKVPYTISEIAHNETLQSTIRKCLSFRLRYQLNYFALIRKETDTIIGKDGRAAVLQIDYSAYSPQRAFQRAQEYHNVFVNFTTIKTINFIGIAVSPKKNVTLRSETYRVEEMNNTKAIPVKVAGIILPKPTNITSTTRKY